MTSWRPTLPKNWQQKALTWIRFFFPFEVPVTGIFRKCCCLFYGMICTSFTLWIALSMCIIPTEQEKTECRQKLGYTTKGLQIWKIHSTHQTNEESYFEKQDVWVWVMIIASSFVTWTCNLHLMGKKHPAPVGIHRIIRPYVLTISYHSATVHISYLISFSVGVIT